MGESQAAFVNRASKEYVRALYAVLICCKLWYFHTTIKLASHASNLQFPDGD